MILKRLMEWVLRYERWWLYVALPLVLLVMHWRVWGLELQGMHVWRQAGTQQTIDLYVQEDFSILNPRQWERGVGDGITRVEFPLYQWLIAAVGKVVGNTVLLTRILSFLIGCFGMWAMQRIVFLLTQDRLNGLLGALLFAFAPVVYYYMVCPLPDVLALTLTMWGLVFLLRLDDGFSWGRVVGAAVFLGLGVLVKLPYAIFLPSFGVWLISEMRASDRMRWKKFAGATLILGMALLPALLWYVLVIPTWGSSPALTGIFFHLADWSEFGKVLAYHFSEMFPRTVINVACLPLLLWGGIRLLLRRNVHPERKRKGRILLAAGLCFLLYYSYEILLINLYHDYYLLPFVPLWVCVAAIGAGEWLHAKRSWVVLAAMALLMVMPYMTYRRIHPRWQDQNAELNLDFVRYKAELRAAVPESALVVVGTDESRCILPYYIHKRCWAWTKSHGITLSQLQAYIAQGATYLYCDDRKYDEDPEWKAILGPEVGRFGTVRVYRLLR